MSAVLNQGFRIEIGVEWYPVRMIRPVDENHPAEEIDPALIDRYRAALKCFLEVQRELGNDSLFRDFDLKDFTYDWERED